MNTQSHTSKAPQFTASNSARHHRWLAVIGTALIAISALLFSSSPALAQDASEIAEMEKVQAAFVKEATELRSKANALAKDALAAKGRFDERTAELASIRAELKESGEQNSSDPEDKKNIANMTKELPALETSVARRKDVAENAEIEAASAAEAAKSAEERVAQITAEIAAAKGGGQ